MDWVASAVAWEGLLILAGGYAFRVLGRMTGSDAKALASAKKISHLKDLEEVVSGRSRSTTTGKAEGSSNNKDRLVGGMQMPMPTTTASAVVAVVGKVGADDAIECRGSSVKAAIIDETAQQVYHKLTPEGTWVKDFDYVGSTRKQVPWYIEDSTGRAHVKDARLANGVGQTLEVVSETYEPHTGGGPVTATIEAMQGIKVLGVKRVEKALLLGTTLTVVAEARRGPDGQVVLQRPEGKGGPFFVSTESVDTLVAGLGACSTFCKWASVGVSALGIAILAAKAVKHILERKRLAELRRRIDEAHRRARAASTAAASASAAPTTTTTATASTGRGSAAISDTLGDGRGEESARAGPSRQGSTPAAAAGSSEQHSTDADSCVICLAEKYNTIFFPCKHMCCCGTCARQVAMTGRNPRCPLCREPIREQVQVFRH